MGFLAPLGFVFALSLPVIVLFYLLKLRRVRRDVPSTMLWQRAAEDIHANAPFQKLRRNLLLLLQLLIAMLLVLGLARPFMNLENRSAGNTVLLIDNSCSMNAADEKDGRTRLDAAKEHARAFVRGMRPGETAMVATFADKAQVLVQFTPDRTKLESAVAAIAGTDLPTRPADAFSLAQSLAKPAGAQILVLSDGAFPQASVQLAAGSKCRFVSFGRSGDNTAITALDLRRPLEGSGDFQVFAMLHNYGAASVSGRLEVRSGARLVDVRPVDIPAGKDVSQVFTGRQLAEGRVELRLDTQDALPADNTAHAVVKPPRRHRVLLVSPGNYFLEHALGRDTSNNLEVVKVAPGQYAATQKADLAIFDNTPAPRGLPPGSYLFINSLPPFEGFADKGVDDAPVIYDWDQQHAIMRYVELGDVRVGAARRYALPPSAQSLVETREDALAGVYSAAGRNAVFLSFDLFDTNLPLRVAFPVLMTNMVSWLLREASPAEGSVLATGDVIQLDAPAEFRRAGMQAPGGRNWALTPNAAGRLLFDRTTHAGFYTAEINGRTAEEFGVSLTDAAESDIAPRASLSFDGGTQVAASQSGLRANREIWQWFVLAALAVVMLEWLVYHRRLWV